MMTNQTRLEELVFDAVMNEPIDHFKKSFREIISDTSFIELKLLKKSLFLASIKNPVQVLDENDAHEKLRLASAILDDAITNGPLKKSDIEIIKKQATMDVNWRKMIKDKTMLQDLAGMIKNRSLSFNDFAISWNGMMIGILSKNATSIMQKIGRGLQWNWLESFQAAIAGSYQDSDIWSRFEEKVGKPAGKTSMRKIRIIMQETYNMKIIDAVKEIESKYPDLSSNSIFNYIQYKVGVLSNNFKLRNENPSLKSEWKRLDADLGLMINKVLKDIHEFGVSKLFTDSLYNKEVLWDYILSMWEEILATHRHVALPSITAQISWSSMKPCKNEIVAMLTGYHDRIVGGLGEISKQFNFSRNSLRDVMNFTFCSFIDKKFKLNDPKISQAYVKYGLPMKNLIKKMRTYVDANMNQFEKIHDLESLEIVHDAWDRAAIDIEQITENYTYKQLEVDLVDKFQKRILNLVEEMKTFGNITDVDIFNTFARFIKKASTRILASYKDIPWENSFEKEFAPELNQLLKDMLKFSTDKMQSNDPNSRADMWDIIKDVIDAALIEAKQKTKQSMKQETSKKQTIPSIQSFLSEYSKDYSREFNAIILRLIDAIKQNLKESLGDIYDMASLQINSANAMTYYFEEKYPAFNPRPLSKSILETVQGYFDDFDAVLKSFLEKLDASSLPNANKIMVLRGILNQSLDYLFATLIKG